MYSRIRTPARILRIQIAVARLTPVISDQDANRPPVSVR